MCILEEFHSLFYNISFPMVIVIVFSLLLLLLLLNPEL